MLILSRTQGETVVITIPGGQEITVVVTKVDRGRTYLGFSAPRDINILRGELIDHDLDNEWEEKTLFK